MIYQLFPIEIQLIWNLEDMMRIDKDPTVTNKLRQQTMNEWVEE